MFAVLNAHKQLELKKRAQFFYDMIGVACAPNQSTEWIGDLQDYWRDVADEAIPEFKSGNKRAIIGSDGTPELGWEQATKVMLAQMEVMRRFAHV